MYTLPLDNPGGLNQRYIVENKLRLPNYERLHGVLLDEWDKFLKNSGIKKPNKKRYRSECSNYETALGAYDWVEDERFHPDIFTGAMAEWFLDQGKAKTPLFLQIGLPGPHPLFDPTRKWADMYENSDIPVPDLSLEEHSLQPAAHKSYGDIMIEKHPDAVRWMEMPTALRIGNTSARRQEGALSELSELSECRGDR
jgi:arylsulfatase